tara:strand:+ start:494 stop:991 length:498 start_codon:yes stop_codon:yes gene_type:complete
MNAQQLLDYIIKPTLEYMGGNFNSKNAQMLLLATAAIESKCGYYIKQINGPALGIWQMEPNTHDDIWENCDAINGSRKPAFIGNIAFALSPMGKCGDEALMCSPMYACLMARLKYSMDKEPLPPHNEIFEIYRYYKRIYNTPLGASTFEKFKSAWFECELDKIVL